MDLYAYDGMTETAVPRIDIYGIIIETVVARSTLSSSANILSYVHYFHIQVSISTSDKFIHTNWHLSSMNKVKWYLE